MHSTVLIGVPAYRHQTYAGLTLSLASAAARLRDFPFDVVEYKSVSLSMVDEARNELLQLALERGVDWLLMIDDDATFEPEVLGELLSLAQAYDDCVVAGVPAPKSDDGEPNVQPWGEGFRTVDRVGGAMMAISLQRLKDLGIKRPWFVAMPQPDGPPYGEDYLFCDRVRELGGKVYCDFRYRVGNGELRLEKRWQP